MTPLEADQFKKHHGESFRQTMVELDGCWFDECTFDHCVLLFTGKLPFHLTDCTFGPITLQPAGDALFLIQCLAMSVPDAPILSMFTDVRIDLRKLGE